MHIIIKHKDFNFKIKNAILHLKEGSPLGVFPAGEVSTYRDGKLVVDKPWEEAAMKLIQKAEVPVFAADAPDQPKIEQITRDSVTLSWKKPINDGGSRITGYIIEKHSPDRLVLDENFS